MVSPGTADSRFGVVCHAGVVVVGPSRLYELGLCLLLVTRHSSIVTAFETPDSVATPLSIRPSSLVNVFIRYGLVPFLLVTRHSSLVTAFEQLSVFSST